MRGHEGMPTWVTTHVVVDDLDATLAKVKDPGGTPLLQPTPIPGAGAFALFQDPEATPSASFVPRHSRHGSTNRRTDAGVPAEGSSSSARWQ